MVVPSLLTGLDLGLATIAKFRGSARHEADSAPGDLSEQTGVASARVRGGNLAGGLRRTLTPLVLAGLDSLDPALERVFGAQCPWGANLVAILGAAPPT